MKKKILVGVLTMLFTLMLGLGTVMADEVDAAQEASLKLGYYRVEGNENSSSIENARGAKGVTIRIEEGTNLEYIQLIFNAKVSGETVAVSGSSVDFTGKKGLLKEVINKGINGDGDMQVVFSVDEIAACEAGNYRTVIPAGFLTGTTAAGVQYTNAQITVYINVVSEEAPVLETPVLTLKDGKVSWTPIEDANHYTVTYKEVFNGKEETPANGTTDQIKNNDDATGLIDRNGYLNITKNFPLKPECEYYVEVIAHPASNSALKSSETARLKLRGEISDVTSAPTGMNWLYSETSQQNTVFSFDVEEGNYYFVKLYKVGEDTAKMNYRGVTESMDLRKRMERHGDGAYYVELWVTDTNDLSLASNKAISPIVIIGNDATQKKNITSTLSSVTEDMSEDEVGSVKEQLTENGLAIIKSVLAKDSEARANYEALEAAVAKVSNIQVGKNLATAEGIFNESVKAEDIKVSGLAINAVSGSSVTMKISDAAESDKISDVSKYFKYNGKTPIQLDIEVDGVDSFAYPVVITMPIPEGFSTSNLIILHESKDADGVVTGVESIYPVVDKEARTMTFAVTHFSTFVVGNEKQTSSNGSGGGNSSSSDSSSSNRVISNNTTVAPKTGTWVLDNTGWWFSFTDKTYPVSTWLKVNEKWYYFDAAGYMLTGWQMLDGKWYYLDAVNGDMAEGWKFIDGKWYYLNPVSGDMADGWKVVDGKWYYLMPVSGECLLDTVTPDGYKVDASGAWIQ